MTSVGAAVAKRDTSPAAMLETYRGDFAQVLPSHLRAETFVRLAQGVLRRNRKLAQVAGSNPASLMHALLDCARLGHEPDTEAFYLVPFGNEIVGIEGYRGEIERIYRAGGVSSVIAEVVREKDGFDYIPGCDERPRHTVNWRLADRGDLQLVYAYASMVGGATSKVVVLNRSDVERHRKESRGWEKPDSPWQRWPESMWLKTAVHQLEKWVPTSSEFRAEQVRAAVAVENARASQPERAELTVDGVTGEVLVAESVDVPGAVCEVCRMPDGDHDPLVHDGE